VLRRQPCVPYLNLTRRSLTVTFKPLDAVKYPPNPYVERVFFVCDHQTRATGCSPASNVASAFAVNHQTHITGLAHLTVHGSGVYTLASTTHRTHRAHPVQRLMLPTPASGHSRDFSKLSTGAIENMCFIFSKASNSAKLARREGERNPNPSLP